MPLGKQINQNFTQTFPSNALYGPVTRICKSCTLYPYKWCLRLCSSTGLYWPVIWKTVDHLTNKLKYCSSASRKLLGPCKRAHGTEGWDLMAQRTGCRLLVPVDALHLWVAEHAFSWWPGSKIVGCLLYPLPTSNNWWSYIFPTENLIAMC